MRGQYTRHESARACEPYGELSQRCAARRAAETHWRACSLILFEMGFASVCECPTVGQHDSTEQSSRLARMMRVASFALAIGGWGSVRRKGRWRWRRGKSWPRLQASSRRHPPARRVWLVPLVQMPPAEYINRNNDFLWRASRFQSPCAYKGNKSLQDTVLRSLSENFKQSQFGCFLLLILFYSSLQALSIPAGWRPPSTPCHYLLLKDSRLGDVLGLYISLTSEPIRIMQPSPAVRPLPTHSGVLFLESWNYVLSILIIDYSAQYRSFDNNLNVLLISGAVARSRKSASRLV